MSIDRIEQRKFLFIVGAPKAGTYSLYETLAQHPEISMSKLKEPNYLIDAVRNARHMRIVTSLDEYLRQWKFEDHRSQWYGEASPSYLRCESTPYRIKALFPDAKIVIVLREPVDRAYSNWKMDVRQGHQRDPFTMAFERDYRDLGPMKLQYEYYKAGLYFAAVRRYLEVFGENNVFVSLFEDLQANGESTLSKIQEFLNIRLIGTSLVRANVAKMPKYRIAASLYSSPLVKGTVGRVLPEKVRARVKATIFSGKLDSSRVSASDAQRIRSYFTEDLGKLEDLINRDLSGWRVDR